MPTFPGARIRLVIVLLLMLAAIQTLPARALADTGSWSAPVKLSNGPDGWFPTIAADDTGRVFVVWQGSVPNVTQRDVSALYYTGYDGRTWSIPNDIQLVSPEGVALRSSLLFDLRGRLDLIYKGVGELTANPLGQEDLWFRSVESTRAAVPANWSEPYRLTQAIQGYYSDMAVDSHGVIHAIWTESSNGSWGIYYRRSLDNGATWSTRIPLDPANPVWWYRAHITVDGQDRIHVIWETLDPKGASVVTDTGTIFGVAKAVYYAVSPDGGITWSTVEFSNRNGKPIPGTSLAPGPQQPTIGVDGQGTILFVYREYGTNRVVYRTSTDSTHWSDSTPLPGVASGVERPYDIYDMITDSAGHVQLAMVGYLTGSDVMALLHLEWDGEKWGAPQVIASSPPFPEYPKLALSDGNRLQIVWFDGDRSTIDRIPIGIWYSTALTTAPAKSRPKLAQDVATPVPESTSTVDASPLLPPMPVVASDPSASTSSFRGLIDGVQQSSTFPLLLGVLPILVVWTLVVIVRLGSSRAATLIHLWSNWNAPFKKRQAVGEESTRARDQEVSENKP